MRQFELYDRSRHRTLGRRCPGQHLEFQILSHRGNNEAGGPFLEPPGTPEIPRLKVRILHAPTCGLGNYPLRRRLVIRRSGNTRAVSVRKNVERMHELGVLHLFTPDSGVCGLIDPILCK